MRVVLYDHQKYPDRDAAIYPEFASDPRRVCFGAI
jgi:hypothetical protein